MRPNVLLVILDSVRARNTSLHGHANRTTPFLEEFASVRATVYEQARAPGARSITSHASIFTGLHVEEHGLASAERALEPGNTVFERLRDEFGYATGVFSENVWITDVDVGLDRGFDRVEGPRKLLFPDALDPRSFVASEGRGQYEAFLRACLAGDRPLRSLANGAYEKVAADYPGLLPDRFDRDTPGDVYADLFLDWVDDREGPWAACVNLMDAHLPYEPGPEYNEWGDEELLALERSAPDQWAHHCGDAPWWRRRAREALYDGAIRQADAVVEEVVTGLQRRGELDDTLVVVTSDHGEGFGEPSRVRPGARVAEHNVAIHEVVLHVPLVVKRPGQGTPDRVREPATLTRFPDVALAAVEGDAGASGGFVPDGPVLASTYGLTRDRQLRERAGRNCEDLSAFDGVARAAYEPADGDADAAVAKYATWKSEAATVAVRDAQTAYPTSSGGRERVEAAFEDVEDAGVLAESDGVGDLDDEVYRELEHLGYV